MIGKLKNEEKLTDRERQVINLVTQGKLNKEVAKLLGISGIQLRNI